MANYLLIGIIRGLASFFPELKNIKEELKERE